MLHVAGLIERATDFAVGLAYPFFTEVGVSSMQTVSGCIIFEAQATVGQRAMGSHAVGERHSVIG
jgi:hypothetical protein